MHRKLIKSLLEQTAYPEPTTKVRLIETHVSFIFLTDSFAYKIKKAVDFRFLNFSTLERRKFYCHEEVRLNRRLCPDIYLGVVELYERAEGASFVSGDRLIDYAVKMKRLPEERMLSRLVSRGEVSDQEMAELGRFIADFHRGARRGAEIDACGSIETIRENWNQNFEQVAPFVGDTIPAADLALIRNWVESFMTGNGALFRARVADGFIRECDGDLHTGNICLTEKVCIFDCIEFNERFRYTDTAADIAFFLMDLDFAGHPEFCRPFLDAYRSATGDDALLPLLDFYKTNRAFIRGKVKSLQMNERGVPPEERAAARREAVRFFRLARGYVLRKRLPPSLIITCGLMGSGKSTLARQLAFELGLSVERSDLVRKELAGVPATGGNPEEYRQGIYTAEFDRKTYGLLAEKAREALSSGRGIIIDATFRRKEDRAAFERLARELDVHFFVLELDCTPELTRERLEKRRLDPTEVSDATWELYPSQLAGYERPAPGESIIVESRLPLLEEVDQALRGMGVLP
jgi:uncharacterized protein